MTVLILKDLLRILGFEEEDWIIDRDVEIGAYTNMPIRFETIILKYLTLIKEFILDDKNGEKNVKILIYLFITEIIPFSF